MYALLGLEQGEEEARVTLVAHHATRELQTQVAARESTEPLLSLKGINLAPSYAERK